MDTIYVDLKLSNFFSGKGVNIRALVDTGAMFMCITREIALQLRFDVEETSTQVVTVADGRRIEAPCVWLLSKSVLAIDGSGC